MIYESIKNKFRRLDGKGAKHEQEGTLQNDKLPG